MTKTYGFTPRQAYNMYRHYRSVLWPEYGITDRIQFSAKPYPKWWLDSFDPGMAETYFSRTTGKPFLITVDGHILPYLHEDELESLILHEMAHVIAGADADHGPEWKRIAEEIGSAPYEFYVFREWEKMPEAYHPTAEMRAAYHNEPTFYYP